LNAAFFAVGGGGINDLQITSTNGTGAGTATLEITDGGIVNTMASSFGGLLPGEICSATVDGIGSQWNCDQDFIIANSGTTTLNILNGATMTVGGNTTIEPGGTFLINFGTNGGTLNTGSINVAPSQLQGTGTINTHLLSSDFDVTFDNSTGLIAQQIYNSLPNQNVTVNWDMSDPTALEEAELWVGYEGTSFLTLRDGLVLELGICHIAGKTGTTGTVNIESGSTLNAYITVGSKGNGTLNISGGGTVTGGGYYSGGDIGEYVGSVGLVTIDGTNSTLSLTGDFKIGYQGQGTVEITNGGTFETDDCSLGESDTGVGMVTVDGTNSSWTGREISFGKNGTGTLHITNGGTANHGEVHIGASNSSGGSGQANVDGSQSNWNISGDLYVGGDGAYSAGNGILNISNGGTVTVGGATSVAEKDTSNGTIQFGVNGGTLNTAMLWTGADDLSGIGTINTRGVGCGADIVFESAEGGVATFAFNQNANQNITVNLDMSSPTDPQTLAIGYRGNGSLAVQSGLTLYAEEFHVGYSSGFSGTATIDGSTMHIASSLQVGSDGTGSLTLINGAKILQDTHSSNTNHIGGNGPNSSLTVSGQGSEIQFSSDVYVQDNGTFHILNRGTVDTGHYYSRMTGGNGLLEISGTGSTLNTYGFSIVKGTANITNGGTLNTTGHDCWIGILPYAGPQESEGVMTVDGTGSSLNTQYYSLYVGYDGNGTLNIQNGGVVNVGNGVYVAREEGATGTIHFDNGTLNTTNIHVAAAELTGNGTINTKGWISDVDIQYDQNHGLNQAITVNKYANQNVTINLDLTNTNDIGLFGAGYKENASLTIAEGVSVTTPGGFLGYRNGALGTATITGTGSTWDGTADLPPGYGTRIFAAGYYGEGHLTVTNGGTVRGLTHIGYYEGSSGSVLVEGPGSKIENGTTMITVGESGSGTLEIRNEGVINAGGFYIGTKTGSSGLVTIDGAGSTYNAASGIKVGAGYGYGNLHITNGGTLVSGTSSANTHFNCISGRPQQESKVIIDGQGSSWTCNGPLGIGGGGMLYVTNGGALTTTTTQSYDNELGGDYGSIGVAVLDGAGSSWNNTSRTLYLGNGWKGYGFVHVSGGANFTSTDTVVEEGSVLSITVGDGSSYTIDGTLTNNGTVRYLAGTAITNNGFGYTPVTATTWDGTGTRQTFGGIWHDFFDRFLLSEKVTGHPGVADEINLTQQQRFQVSPVGSTQTLLGISFNPNSTTTEGDTTISLTASPTDSTLQGELAALLDQGEGIVNSWDISTDLAEGEFAYLSMAINGKWENLTVWHHDGTGWAEYELPDYSCLTFDGTYANFLVDSFSSYAVTGTAVPEPSTVALLLAMLAGFFVLRKRSK
jgi:T5SS/PEP-CTERM-associated repeat protein